MKRFVLLCYLLLLAWSIRAVPVRIFHTNDTHGAYEPRNYRTPEGNIALGGYLSLWEHLDSLRAEAPRSIYLDAGDQQTGTAFAAMPYAGAVGGAVIQVFNRLGLDASTYGNHEFDHSPANLARLRSLARYPFVSSNLFDTTSSQPLGNKPWHVITRDSLRIGILGLTLVELPEKVKIDNVSGLRILPYKEAIGMFLEDLDRQTDLIVVLSHNGFEADSLLATQLDNRVDLIIGGHSHSYIESPTRVNGIYILQAGSYLSHLGLVDLEVENDRVTAFDSRLIQLRQVPISRANPLMLLVRQMSDRIEAQLGQVIASLPEDWVPDKFSSTALSRWMANSLKAQYQEIYQPDLAIVNNGGFRKLISAGPVTLRDMHEMLPFNNTVTVFSCYGRDILSWDALNAQIALAKPYDICQSTAPGWAATMHKDPNRPGETDWDGYTDRFFDLGGQRLNPDKVYRVISHDYVAGQWDKYLGFKPFDVYDTGELFLDAMVREVIKQYGIKP